MRLISAQQQKALDAYLVGRGVPILLLMEAAGRALAETAQAMVTPPAVIDFFAGPGMNGGDLYAAARILSSRRFHCRIWELEAAAETANETVRQMRRAALACGIETGLFADYEEADERPALALDGLLGTGFNPNRALSEELAEGFGALALARARGALVLACDLPSGVTADWGSVHEKTVPADCTVTFVCPKVGQMQSPACQYNGELVIADLDLPHAFIAAFPGFHEKEQGLLPGAAFSAEESLAKALPLYIRSVDEAYFRAKLPSLPGDAHKGTQGHALLIAGRSGMAGAARFCTEAALRSGTGLVSLVCSKDIYPEVFAALPSPLYSVPEDDSPAALLRAVLAKKDKAKAVLAGPGLGLGEATARLLEELLNWPQPLILDADALTVLAAREDGPEVLRARRAAGRLTLLTPHGGEAQRLARPLLAEQTAPDFARLPRLKQVRLLAEGYGSYVLLKGEASLVGSPDGCRILVNKSGGPGLAKGGSGDILAGLIAGLAAQGLPLETAACLGMYWHGAAGDLAAGKLQARSMTPPDTLAALSAVLFA